MASQTQNIFDANTNLSLNLFILEMPIIFPKKALREIQHTCCIYATVCIIFS